MLVTSRGRRGTATIRIAAILLALVCMGIYSYTRGGGGGALGRRRYDHDHHRARGHMDGGGTSSVVSASAMSAAALKREGGLGRHLLWRRLDGGAAASNEAEEEEKEEEEGGKESFSSVKGSSYYGGGRGGRGGGGGGEGDIDYDGGLLGDSDDDENVTCKKVRKNNRTLSCEFVRENCAGEAQLIDYLSFVFCSLGTVQPLAYVFLVLWLLYLISLLATTADYFFVPPLSLLADKMHLSPSIAGITLLAIGNGAPDVFTAYSALKGNDIALVLSALIGASMFISTVVLGTIILITSVNKNNIDKIDFFRDIVVYIVVVGLVVGICFDGNIHVWEAALFPTVYILYIAVAVIVSFIRRKIESRKRPLQQQPRLSSKALLEEEEQTDTKDEGEDENKPLLIDAISESLGRNRNKQNNNNNKQKLTLAGLTWPRGSHIGVKIQWFLEWPFSLVRWLSIPPCNHDGHWTVWHHWFAVTSPIPMTLVLLIAAAGWDGFAIRIGGVFPLIILLVVISFCISIALFFLLSPKKPPHWSMQIVLGVAGFVMSIAWLNIEANETVAVLDSFGLLFEIDTAILGLTVLAIGNSVGDWVADTAVARAGQPGMGVASCFGSPLLNDVLGLSVALIGWFITNGGKTFTFDISQSQFGKVKMSWIFLGISLLASLVVFPLFRFSPPKPFGVALIYTYLVFMVFSILDELKILPIFNHN